MKKLTVVQGVLIGLATLLVVVGAHAGPKTRKHKFTFSQPVRVPGTTLDAGTYYFEKPLENTKTLVKISDESGKLVTQVLGMPEKTPKGNHEVIVFGSHECGPTAIKVWFYPGAGNGVRFVYPKEEAASIAASCNEPVPEMHENTPDVTDKIYLVTPKGQEEEYKPEALSASDQMDQNGFDAGAAEQQPKR